MSVDQRKESDTAVDTFRTLLSAFEVRRHELSTWFEEMLVDVSESKIIDMVCEFPRALREAHSTINNQ